MRNGEGRLSRCTRTVDRNRFLRTRHGTSSDNACDREGTQPRGTCTASDTRAVRRGCVTTLLGLVFSIACGCAAIPEVAHEPQFHNPFPQLHRVAVLPFFNQSNDPTLSQDRVALAYYNELQQIPGFEVMPVGVVKRKLSNIQQIGETDFQELGKLGLQPFWLRTHFPLKRRGRWRLLIATPNRGTSSW